MKTVHLRMTHVKPLVIAFCTKTKSNYWIHCWISLVGGRLHFWSGRWSLTDSIPRNSLLPAGYAQPRLPGCLWKRTPSKTGSFEKGWIVTTKLFPSRGRLLVQNVDIKLDILAYGHSRDCIFDFLSLSFLASNLGFWLRTYWLISHLS